MSKKRIIIGVSIMCILVISITLILITNKSSSKVLDSNLENTTNNSDNKAPGMFAIMLETEVGSGVYEKSTSSTWPESGYIFNENLSACENGGELSWNSETKAVTLHSNKADKCYVYFDKYNPPTLAEYIINNVYVEDGVNDLYYHDGVGTYTNASEEAGDNSYRYSGANPNNYVCFGSDVRPCPSGNLYRIIGVFNDTGEYQVKLIMADYPSISLLGTNGTYDQPYEGWMSGESYKGNTDLSSIGIYRFNNEAQSSLWSDSNLNIINLNENYLSNLGNYWNDFIEIMSWETGGNQNMGDLSVKNVYQNEIISPIAKTEYNSKIGLMYVSDYGYGADPIYWTTLLKNYRNARNDNWLGQGLTEMTITPFNTMYIYHIIDGGMLSTTSAVDRNAVRPVFYLNSDVTYTSGTGTRADPYIIGM